MNHKSKNSHIAVLGCGAWATTIANHIASQGTQTRIWCHREEVVTQINSQTRSLLPGISLSHYLEASLDCKEVVQGASAIILCVPARYLESVIKHWEPSYHKDQPVLSLIKGIFSEKYLLIEAYLKAIFPDINYTLLSGPNLALEIAQGKPAASVVASRNKKSQMIFQDLLSNEQLRIYRSDDVEGVAMGGIIKNIMAIAAGCIDAMELGVNTKSTLITRGLREMIECGKSLGAETKTFYGLSGLGDLIATSVSPLSRNYQCGYTLGKGKTATEFETSLSAVAEGIQSTRFIYTYSRERDIIMPITEMVYNVLQQSVSIQDAIKQLMTRDLKSE